MNPLKRAMVYTTVFLLAFSSFNFYTFQQLYSFEGSNAADTYISVDQNIEGQFVSEIPTQSLNAFSGENFILRFELSPCNPFSKLVFANPADVGIDYFFLSQIISIPLPETAIIFPFHYFF